MVGNNFTYTINLTTYNFVVSSFANLTCKLCGASKISETLLERHRKPHAGNRVSASKFLSFCDMTLDDLLTVQCLSSALNRLDIVEIFWFFGVTKLSRNGTSLTAERYLLQTVHGLRIYLNMVSEPEDRFLP